jgi:hypothetical protein
LTVDIFKVDEIDWKALAESLTAAAQSPKP